MGEKAPLRAGTLASADGGPGLGSSRANGFNAPDPEIPRARNQSRYQMKKAVTFAMEAWLPVCMLELTQAEDARIP
jgi:hypothetical protein